MYRGTTPTFFFKVKDDIILDDIAEVWISIKSQNVTLQRTLKDVVFNEEEKTIALTLSQEDTLSLTGPYAIIQLRILFKDKTACASKIIKLQLEDVLRSGIMELSKEEEKIEGSI